jgi:hypothetical protein
MLFISARRLWKDILLIFLPWGRKRPHTPLERVLIRAPYTPGGAGALAPLQQMQQTQLKVRVAQFCADATVFLRAPPRELDVLGARTLALYKAVPDVNVYVHALLRMDGAAEKDEFNALVRLMLALRDEMYLNSLCDTYHVFLKLVPMEFEHPASGVMLLYLCTASIAVVLDSLHTKTNGPADATWAVKGPPTRYVCESLLCAVANTPVCEYSTSQVLAATQLVAMRWYQLDPQPALLAYLLGLVHRGFVLVSKPGTEHSHDDPAMRNPAALPGYPQGLWAGNWDLLRRLAGGLSRMVAITRFRLLTPKGDLGPAPPLSLDRINTALTKEVIKLEFIQSIRRELKNLCNTSGLWFGDLDVFVEQCNTDPPKPLDVIFNAKPQDIQQAWMYLNSATVLERLCNMREDAPCYHNVYTYMHHFYMQNMKLYAADMLTKERQVKLLADHCVAEQDFVGARATIAESPLPVLLQNFGKYHVFHRGELFVCGSVEQALLTWVLLVQQRHESLVDGSNMTGPFAKLLNEAPVFSDTDAWRDQAVIPGEVDL